MVIMSVSVILLTATYHFFDLQFFDPQLCNTDNRGSHEFGDSSVAEGRQTITDPVNPDQLIYSLNS